MGLGGGRAAYPARDRSHLYVGVFGGTAQAGREQRVPDPAVHGQPDRLDVELLLRGARRLSLAPCVGWQSLSTENKKPSTLRGGAGVGVYLVSVFDSQQNKNQKHPHPAMLRIASLPTRR